MRFTTCSLAKTELHGHGPMWVRDESDREIAFLACPLRGDQPENWELLVNLHNDEIANKLRQIIVDGYMAYIGFETLVREKLNT